MPTVLSSAFVALVAYSSYKLAKFFYHQYTLPINHLPGPESKSWIFGNIKEIWLNDNSVVHEKWVASYGRTLKYKAMVGTTRLFTMDTKALAHVLMHSHIYQKPEASRYFLSLIVGEGVLVAEGESHRQQRRVMNPAFGTLQIRELTEIFMDKAIELRDIWAAEVAQTDGETRIDALSWLSRMTLDVIGLAGFNYRFDALSSDPEKNELNKAFSTLFKSESGVPLISFLRGVFPALRILPAARDVQSKQAKKTMNRIGQQLMKDSKASLMATKGSGTMDTTDKDPSRRRDLLTLLIRANMATDLHHSQRMSDEDVLAQVPTFLVAGHETTSVGTAWALYSLTQYPDVQEKLRTELLTVSTDNPTMDDLNALPYLDAFVRETLRVHAPVPSSIREATQDDVIPLEHPVKDEQGNLQHYVRVTKGQTIFIPILAINRSKDIWGEDAHDFKPERWQSIPEAATSIPGVWGNQLTFLGGTRACIGYRFSLVEMKALLFTLVRAFEFQLAVPANEIKKKSNVVQRPVLVSDGKNQMPLLVKPYRV
ncbi:Cytochrome P450 [Amanita muscaria]